MTADILIVDPPDGHRYGFPKAVPDDRRHDIIAWIVEQGYPRSIIDEWAEGRFPLRCWWEETPQDADRRAALEGPQDRMAKPLGGDK